METVWSPKVDKMEKPLYLALVRALAEDIQQSRLRQDMRLPTQRELADRLGVALGTVTRAYVEAERRGMIRSEGRRGTFVGPASEASSSLASLVRRQPDAVDLSKNHPDYGLDPDLQSALRRIARSRQARLLLEYPDAAGMPHHREAGAKWLSQMGARVEPEAVFITSGAQHGLSVILGKEAQRGDVIAAENFTYPGIKAIAQQFELPLAPVASDNDGIVPDALEAVCRHRRVRFLYCNPTLSNPANSVMPSSRKEALADVAARYGLTVIEDEIMRPFLPDQTGFISSLLPDQSYLVVSVSKPVAAGLRVGFVVAPAATRHRLGESLTTSCLAAPPLTAELFTVWLGDGTIERVINRRRKETSFRQAIAERILSGLKFRNHPLSYHLWLELPEGWSAMRLAMEAHLRGTVIAPSEIFAVEPRPSLEAVRLSVVVPPTREILEKGLATVAGLVRGYTDQHLPTV
jgi:DNA-binding transcriptional MocR family regulator